MTQPWALADFAESAPCTTPVLKRPILTLTCTTQVLKRLASETSGVFGVAASPQHLRQFVLQLVTPRPSEQAAPGQPGSAPSNSLIRIGFPERRPPGGAPMLCFGPASGGQMQLGEARYSCPQCSAAHAEIPTVCPICNLRLMSSVDLTKTYHHLFPLPVFAEVRATCSD